MTPKTSYAILMFMSKARQTEALNHLDATRSGDRAVSSATSVWTSYGGPCPQTVPYHQKAKWDQAFIDMALARRALADMYDEAADWLGISVDPHSHHDRERVIRRLRRAGGIS